MCLSSSNSHFFFATTMSTNRVPLILFSGGLDSSYLLQTKLREGNVEVLYVRGSIDPRKMEIEEARRRKIINILEKETGNKVRREHRIDLGYMPFGCMNDRSFTQPTMWMMGALMASDVRKHTELLIGYVSGDQIMSLLSHIRAAWDQLQSVSKYSGNIPVNFPLQFLSKTEILNLIHPDVMRQVWWCESPQLKTYSLGPKQEPHEEDPLLTRSTVRPCGYCLACRRMKTTFLDWKLKERRPYSQYIIQELHYYRRTKKQSTNPEDLVEVEN